MRKKLLGLFVILMCYGAVIGFTSIKPEKLQKRDEHTGEEHEGTKRNL